MLLIANQPSHQSAKARQGSALIGDREAKREHDLEADRQAAADKEHAPNGERLDPAGGNYLADQ